MVAQRAAEERADVVHEYLVLAGLTLTRDGSSTWRGSIETWGEDLPLLVQMSQHWLLFDVDPFLQAPASGEGPEALAVELLRMNRELQLVKFGLSEGSAVVLTAELPTEHLELAEVMMVLQAITSCVEEHRARLAMLVSGQ
jgi:hypothetical protein